MRGSQTRSWFSNLWRRARLEREMDAELRFHLDARAADLERGGLSPAEARRRARLEFGSLEATKEEARQSLGLRLVDELRADLRYAVRMLVKSPMFTAVALVTLALGIGVNAALFTVVNAVLLKPLPVPNPNHLTLLVWDWQDGHMQVARGYEGSATRDNSPTGNLEGTSFPILTYERLRASRETFSEVFAFVPIEQLNLIADGGAEIASGQYVSGGYYSGMGLRAWRGRTLTDDDDRESAPPAAVLSWAYWQRRFGGENSAIGKKVVINGIDFTIVGVTPPDFSGALELGEAADVSIPLHTDPLVHPGNSALQTPGVWWLRLMARLQPGVSHAQAQARLDPVFQQSVMDAWNSSLPTGREIESAGSPRTLPHLMVNSGARGDEFARRQYREPLAMLMMVVGLVLMLACINVANLLLARSAARQQEFAVRVALGASRFRLMRQLLTESLLLSIAAGVAGALFAVWSKDLLLHWAQWMSGTTVLQADIDVRVLGFTIAVSLLTGILFGLLPALRAGGAQVTSSVKAQIGHAGRSRSLAGRALIVAQVAISVVLLAGAGLFLRTMRNLHHVDAGFDRSNLLLFRVRPESNGYTDDTSRPLYDRLLEEFSRVPGVRGAAFSRHGLLSFSHAARGIYAGANNPHNGDIADVNIVSPGFFQTLGIPLLLGRDLLQSDTPTAPSVAVVNEAFARTYFPGGNPIGQQFWLGGGGEGRGNPSRRSINAPPNNNPIRIVGVTRDAKYIDLRTRIRPTVYPPYSQMTPPQANFEIRYRGDEAAIASSVREAVRRVDPRLPIFEMRTQVEQSERSMAEETMFANLSSSMGGLTLLLVAVGLYGIMQYSVGRRTAEIGLRMALGAQPSSVLTMVLRESIALVVVGLAIGIPAALGSARLVRDTLADLLYGVQPSDPATLAAAAGVMGLIALLAAYGPARRAAAVDPMVALRHE